LHQDELAHPSIATGAIKAARSILNNGMPNED
jgi:hypothetical protein